MTALFWAVQFVLEAAGAHLNFRKSKVLSLMLAVCALGDFSAFVVLRFAPQYFCKSGWYYMAAKGLMLIWLGCSICGMFVAEQDKAKTILAAGFISCASMSIVMAVFFASEALKDRLLSAEICTNLLLFGMIFLGWLGRRTFLSREWQWIAAGFLLMIGLDLAVTLLWYAWDGAPKLYPLGNVLALSLWIAGPLSTFKQERKAEEQIQFGRFLPAVDRNPVENIRVM